MIHPKAPSTKSGIKLYTLREAREYLCLGREALARYIKEGLIRPVRYGFRRWYISEGELDHFLRTTLGKEIAERAGLSSLDERRQ